jgi:hypothetical protein
MSIDDSVGRDPRISYLAELLGWSRRETVGALVCDVWPICYDMVDSVIAIRLVDIAAQHKGFALLMVEAGLATTERGGLKIRVAGAEERLKYLEDRREAGRVGGLKSAELRRRNSSKALSSAQASLNPPDSVPDPVPDSASKSAAPPFALSAPSPKKLKKKNAETIPDGWSPDATGHRIAGELRLDIAREARRFADNATAKGLTYVDWQAAFRTWMHRSSDFQRDRQPAQVAKPAVQLAAPTSDASHKRFDLSLPVKAVE